MDTVGGSIERPRERGHTPTFWPVPSLVTLQGASGGLHLGFEAPTAVSLSPAHSLEWIVARNPVKERAFGLLPVLAHPIGGTNDELQTHRACVFATDGRGDSSVVLRSLRRAWLPPAQRPLEEHAETLTCCDDPAASIVAVKRADVGPGVIVRLACPLRAQRTVRLWTPSHEVARAYIASSREENIEPLTVEGGAALVPITSRLTTVRLVTR
jgi:hypothetical protein